MFNKPDDLWLVLIGEMEARRQKGLEQYGVPVTANEAHDWLKELEDELLDGLVYLRAVREVKAKMQSRIDQLERALAEALPYVTPSASEWLVLGGSECSRIREVKERLTHVLEGLQNGEHR